MREVLVTDFSSLMKNEVVKISDGSIEPPKHHTKKHARWHNKNRTVLVHRFEPAYGLLGVKSRENCVLVDCLNVRQLTVHRLVD
ncbi:hypothetical protein [Vibrio anguillarum]|uniref:Uncharacterized protein n=1 Tax=Vibrio anguillarum TaxID=55601 RepID=A0A7U6FS20_VIBAN|nr:hypothetical protein [Vibrio anguillarum]AZS26281.1 hypothetical protein DYL72_15340 [Vibrio anguillarum]MBF4374562.1 hypothetical protein [Vibrio anguillarum]